MGKSDVIGKCNFSSQVLFPAFPGLRDQTFLRDGETRSSMMYIPTGGRSAVFVDRFREDDVGNDRLLFYLEWLRTQKNRTCFFDKLLNTLLGLHFVLNIAARSSVVPFLDQGLPQDRAEL